VYECVSEIMSVNKMVTLYDAGYKYLLMKFPDLYRQKSNTRQIFFVVAQKVVHVAKIFHDINFPKHVSPNTVCYLGNIIDMYT